MSTLPEVACGACGQPTPPGRFCIHCGTQMQQRCPSCGTPVGTPVVPGAKFCLECGAALRVAAAAAPAAIVSERRLVSVLFADLVGFTTLLRRRGDTAAMDEAREIVVEDLGATRWLEEVQDRYGVRA